MADQTTTIAGRILAGLLGFLSGGAGGMGGGIAGRIMGGAAGPGGVPVAIDYPPRRSSFDYRISYMPGPPQFNAAYNGDPEPMRMQTLDQHNRALTKYVKPGMNPAQVRWAIEKGKEEEKALPEFWSDDNSPRVKSARSSSSAVSGVRIRPDNTIAVQFGGRGKWYTYRGGATPYEAALAAHDLVTSRSLGRNMNRYNPASWGAKHKLF